MTNATDMPLTTSRKALDLFCGAGGASMGLHRAGYDVTGVDINPQPNYPFEFVQADALEYPLDGYDFIWASPPCQAYSMYSRNLGTSENYPDLVGAVRDRLLSQETPWVIENVPGAPLRRPLLLCGSMFDGLNVIRHRLFELSFSVEMLLPPCAHTGKEIPVYGRGTPEWHRKTLGRNIRADEQRDAMAIHWTTRNELVQAIPPAYSEFLARHVRAIHIA